MLFKAVFKVDDEVFRLLVQWIGQKGPKPGMEETPLFRWLRKHRKDSVSLATAVAWCVLYLFGRGSLNEKAGKMLHESCDPEGRRELRTLQELITFLGKTRG